MSAQDSRSRVVVGVKTRLEMGATRRRAAADVGAQLGGINRRTVERVNGMLQTTDDPRA
jgi:N-methylhydantoinase A/oxoprolinase/acetone carboxylase beta subunit